MAIDGHDCEQLFLAGSNCRANRDGLRTWAVTTGVDVHADIYPSRGAEYRGSDGMPFLPIAACEGLPGFLDKDFVVGIDVKKPFHGPWNLAITPSAVKQAIENQSGETVCPRRAGVTFVGTFRAAGGSIDRGVVDE